MTVQSTTGQSTAGQSTGQSGSLPAELTAFVGRAMELDELAEALRRSRLVTLTGVGGVGKSRLALRAATLMRGAYPGGAWFVELSALRRPDLLTRTVADALRLPDLAAVEPLELIADHLARRRALLVLDTCEHLVDGCAELAEALLRAAPELRVLTTSREPLNVIGEHVVAVPPLGDPDSVRLFADRAEAMAPAFAVTAANRELVAGLCRRLDGLPLAIELAAVRLRTMSIEQLDQRLDDRFRLLGGARRGHDRHQTLRAAVEWSHELCTGEEKRLWARLSVFPGTFDLTAADRICGGDTVGTLGRLVEKSIVVWEENGDRYRMLDAIREYGAERLEELGEGAALRGRHQEHYFALAAQAMRTATGDRQIPVLQGLRAESANLRVAFDHALATPGQERAGLRLTARLWPYWMMLGLLGEPRVWCRRALAAAPEPCPERGWAAHGAALFATLQGDADDAAPLLDEAQEAADRYGDEALAGHIMQTRARIALLQGDVPSAIRLHEKAGAVFAEIGYPDSYALGNFMLLGCVFEFAREPDRALEVCEEGLRICRAHGDLWSETFTLYVRAGAYWLKGEIERALADSLEALAIRETYGDLFGITVLLDLVKGCLVSMGEFERGALLDGATLEYWRSLGAPVQLGPDYLEIQEMVRTANREGMSPAAYQAAVARGAELTVEQAVVLARRADTMLPRRLTDTAPQPLTRRERQVAELVAEGLTNRDIAGRLTIAKRTVDSHIEHIMAKLGVASRTEIAAWSRRRSRTAS
ncbi:ATP-binding protein [Actinomadura macrotermitis]|uniref:HTH luxR-type domain-containing protein n=1 Tax=Actinomadura macrotermitis TaxID=2585200 RepID=A0A7K0C7Z2_9ACTN|nr:LuxR C-terminal-related transcriptional regulator [Actinomadura macrotermitis]MQY09555.1 hypothetical protein [Actinomadura macrotermitis]